MRLTPEDQQVIDLLLDGNGTGQLDGATDGAFKQRLQAAQRVLRTLDALPAIDEPSTHLIDRTLQRVEDAAHQTPQVEAAYGYNFVPSTGH